MQRLRDAFDKRRVVLDLDASDIEAAICATVAWMVSQGLLSENVASQVEAQLLKREQDAPTAIGHATSIPHAYLEDIDKQVVAFVRLARPVNLGAPDGIPTRFLFFLLGPPGSPADHLDTLASIARLMSEEEFRYQLGEADSTDDLLEALDRATARTKPEPTPAEKSLEGLTYTGKLAGGVREDIARRLPFYFSDFVDGFHPKCLASILFLTFACLAPAVIFGGVMAEETGGQIGPVEMITASAICGVVFALTAGQPLIILGGTGPLLVFTAILYSMCVDQKLPFLETYAWVGLWSAGFIILMAVTDASALMKYFTRFTDEIFSGLISLIFIYQAIKSLIYIFQKHITQKADVVSNHDIALLTLLLAMGTFYIAMSLSRFRKSHYLLPKIREFLADFGPAIALVSMTVIAVWLAEVNVEKLNAPEKFGTTANRPWLINLFSEEMPVWARFAAAGPALLVAVLVYLDQNITARIVNSPDHRLHKGVAYHLDLFVVGVLVGGCSLFGLPWLVAATVRSLNHVRSLATVEEVVTPTGETRERVVHVRENRITALAIHLLIGLSLLLLQWMQYIPMAVLYGLFLFMGVVSMSGNQLFERMSLWLRDPALYPVTHYIRRVPKMTIHLFTLIQTACLAVLWVVKGSAIGILFPVFIALLVPVRMFIGRFFSQEDLEALDADEEPEEEQTHWAA